MQVLFINNAGGGFADYVQVEDGLTVDAFVQQKMPGNEPSNLLIRVNRLPVASDAVLHGGDRVSITPTKIQGA